MDELSYNSSHLPLHDMPDILGHCVRTMYLLVAAADFGGEFANDARRLLDDAIDHKMYVNGSFGTEPLPVSSSARAQTPADLT